MNIPFTVLGGYLGAGKTTLVNHLLANAEGERLALIINDFGAINIDAELISEETDDQINLTNGCICCGMSAGFDEALEGLLARVPAPDRIIVEASGVADVVSLAQYGHHPGLMLDGIVVLADAETVRAKARDKYVDKTVLRQLKGADLLLLSKTDLVSEQKLEGVETWLRELAPDTPIVRASYGQVPVGAIFGIGHSNRPDELAQAGHERYLTWSFSAEQPLNREQIEAFLAELPAGVLRGKGFFTIKDAARTTAGRERLLYQQVGQRVTLTPLPPGSADDDCRFVLIGLEHELRTTTLDELAARHLN